MTFKYEKKKKKKPSCNVNHAFVFFRLQRIKQPPTTIMLLMVTQFYGLNVRRLQKAMDTDAKASFQSSFCNYIASSMSIKHLLIEYTLENSLLAKSVMTG